MHQRPKRGYHGRRMAIHMAWGISTNGDIGMKHVSELANFAEVEPNPNWSIYSPICKLVNLCLVRFSSSGIECWFDTDGDNVIKWFSTYVAQILQSLLMWLWPTKTHGTNWESKKLMCEAAWGKTQLGVCLTSKAQVVRDSHDLSCESTGMMPEKRVWDQSECRLGLCKHCEAKENTRWIWFNMMACIYLREKI